MPTESLQRVATFQDASAALRAFDERFWMHDPGLPTIRHTMIHLCLSLGKPQQMVLGTLSGLALEHALRLLHGHTGDFMFDAWCANNGVLRTAPSFAQAEKALHDVRTAHLELAQIVHDMEEGETLGAVSPRLTAVVEKLLHAGLCAQSYVIGTAAMQGPRAWEGLASRLVHLYAKHNVTVAFVDPVSA